MHPRLQRISVLARAFAGDLRTSLRSAASVGFTGVVLDSISPAITLHELSQSGRRELLHVVSSCNLSLTAVQAKLPGDGFAPRADVEASLAHATRALQAAADLKCSLLLLELGALPPAAIDVEPAPQPVDPGLLGLLVLPSKKDVESIASKPAAAPVRRDEAFEQSCDAALAELGQRADRFGVVVALRASLSSFASIDRAVRASRCPWFGVDLDPLAILADDEPMDAVLARVGPHVRHVRLRDGTRGLGNRVGPTLIGEGKLPFPQLLSLLDDASFNGPLTLDPSDLPNPAIAAELGLHSLRR
jgi:sugar phosphate isomerase/epimerase